MSTPNLLPRLVTRLIALGTRHTAVGMLLIAGGMPAFASPTPPTQLSSFQVKTQLSSPKLVLSPTGLTCVSVDATHKDTARGTWSYQGLQVVNLATGSTESRHSRARVGRNTPVFSRNGTWLAWCDQSEPGRVAVHRRQLQSRTGRESDLTATLDKHIAARSYPTLCAIADDGQDVVLFDPGSSRGHERLLIFDTAQGVVEATFPHFREPYFSGVSFQAVLTDRFLLAHSRPDDATSGASYRLVVTDRTGDLAAQRYGAYVSMQTPRFQLLRDGRTLLNGTGGFEIEEIDLVDAREVAAIETRKALYSHFLEVTVSPDEQHVIAWSRERSQVVHWQRGTRKRTVLPLEERCVVVGIDVASRLIVKQYDAGLRFMDLDKKKEWRDLLPGKLGVAILNAAGTCLVTGHEEEGEWQLTAHALSQTAANRDNEPQPRSRPSND